MKLDKRDFYRSVWVSGLLFWFAAAIAQSAIPADAFFSGVRVKSAALSPDGRYVSLISVIDGNYLVQVVDRANNKSVKIVTAGDGEHRIIPRWCGWANNTRLLCGFYGVTSSEGRFYPFSRLVAVNADGSDMKVLRQTKTVGYRNLIDYNPQYQDRIIDWTPNDPDTVLMQLDDDLDGYPDVVSVNVNTGRRKTLVPQRLPILQFITDGQGEVRLGLGFFDRTKDRNIYYLGRLSGEEQWRTLAKVENFSRDEIDVFEPFAVMPGTNAAYATRYSHGRKAIWQLDLADKNDPAEIFSHPVVDVDDAVFTPDKQLIGVAYDYERPEFFYFDEEMRSVVKGLDLSLPNAINRIVDMSRDRKVILVSSESDIAPTGYYVIAKTAQGASLERLGSALPALGKASLSKMRSIAYAASDGTVIPGYLTLPVGKPERNLPLIVMPHGGPVLRDTWGFDPWVQFLAARGYAVLQMNFRGSGGYGAQWYWSAHQDWGGLTYSDITDATRWAIKQGIADPKRICIVGGSFGGYAALLGATRNSDLYRCAVSIAGVSDLQELIRDRRDFMGWTVSRPQLSADPDKLKADSPRRHVDSMNIPLLMIHGERDYTVTKEHTDLMAGALKAADKKFKVVIVEQADHYFEMDADMRMLYNALDGFLGENLPTN